MASDGLSIVGEAADGHEAIRVWRDLDGPPVPDVVILDNRMPGLSGLDVARAIIAERPSQLLVLYRAFLDDHASAAAAQIGTARCVSKHDPAWLPGHVRELPAASPGARGPPLRYSRLGASPRRTAISAP